MARKKQVKKQVKPPTFPGTFYELKLCDGEDAGEIHPYVAYAGPNCPVCTLQMEVWGLKEDMDNLTGELEAANEDASYWQRRAGH